jgi:hypothetical protein
VRRDRTYELTLIGALGRARPISRISHYLGDSVESQSVYRVAPGGRWLAFRDGDALSLMNSLGQRWQIAPAFDDFRFSADGHWLAVTTSAHSTSPRYDHRRAGELIFVELGRWWSQVRRHVAVAGLQRIEWSAAGVVVHHVRMSEQNALEDELLLVPLTGASRPLYHGLYEGAFDRFASAARGTRVLVFTNRDTVELDAAQALPELRHHEGVFTIKNVEMAADGSGALVVSYPLSTSNEYTFLFEQQAVQRALHTGSVYGVWPADEGARFVWQAPDGIHVGARDFPLVVPTDAWAKSINSVRFRRDAAGLIAARDDDVVAWDERGGHEKVLWRVKRSDVRLIGADSFAGGVVVWQEIGDKTAALP